MRKMETEVREGTLRERVVVLLKHRAEKNGSKGSFTASWLAKSADAKLNVVSSILSRLKKCGYCELVRVNSHSAWRLTEKFLHTDNAKILTEVRRNDRSSRKKGGGNKPRQIAERWRIVEKLKEVASAKRPTFKLDELQEVLPGTTIGTISSVLTLCHKAGFIMRSPIGRGYWVVTKKFLRTGERGLHNALQRASHSYSAGTEKLSQPKTLASKVKETPRGVDFRKSIDLIERGLMFVEKGKGFIIEGIKRVKMPSLEAERLFAVIEQIKRLPL